MLGLPLKCFHNSSEWKAFQGLSSHNNGFGITLQLTIISTTILFLNNSWNLIQPGMYSQNIKKIEGFQQVLSLVSWRDLTSDLHNCLVFTMPVNYLVRLSQRENNWRSYLQQNCSPGQSSQCPGRSSDRPEGGGWCQSASQSAARCHNYILAHPAIIVLLSGQAQHPTTVVCWSSIPHPSHGSSGYLQCFVLVCKARAADSEGELL